MADCVWAGDVNGDGIVNNKDILPLGYWMGENGLARPNAALEWYGQGAPNWANPYTGFTLDLKHVDTDGDGAISAADTTAIGSFYGKTHNVLPTMLSPDKGLPFKLTLLTPPPLEVGDLVRIQVSARDGCRARDQPVRVHFRHVVEPANRDSIFHMDFKEDSWMNFNAPTLNFQRRPRQGRLETALTHTNGLNASGHGIIGEVGFIVVDIIDGTRGDAKHLRNCEHPDARRQRTAGGYGDQIIELPISKGREKRPTQPRYAMPTSKPRRTRLVTM